MSDESMKKEIDKLECSSSDDGKIEDSDCNDDDLCSSSSSFSATVSQHDDDDETTEQTASNDQEADSLMMCADASLPFWVRKKKVTDQWRRFIHPITWRCKWLELKIRELQSQAGMYDRESCQAKQLELEKLKSEEELGGVKALSLLPCCSTQKTRLKKRRKRKRVEEASSYALNHNLFSYHENRKSFGDLNDNSRNLYKKNKNAYNEEAVFCEEETLHLEFRKGDDVFLEQILLKIEAVKLAVHNLKNRVDKVVNENPTMFSLVILNEDEKPVVISEEKPVKSASVSSHHNDTQPEEDDDETTEDILLSEMMASSRQREGKAIVPNNKLQKTEQASVGEGSSRPVRIRKPRNLDVEVKEETKRKRRKVSKEKRPNRQRKRGKRRSGGRRS